MDDLNKKVNDQYNAGHNKPIPKPKMLGHVADINETLARDYRTLEKEYNRLLLDVNTLRKHMSKSEKEFRNLNKDFEQFKRETQMIVNTMANRIAELEESTVQKKKG